MKLTVINGSPKGKGSNTRVLLDSFLEGFQAFAGNSNQVFYLNRKSEDPELQKNYLNASAIIVAFPLYTDAMPGIVKEYFETLWHYRGVNPGLKLGFIVQSGFPEAIHSFYVARYLRQLAINLETEYLGTIIKGGVEGIQIMPSWMNRKTIKAFYKLGYEFGHSGRFNEKMMARLARPIKFSGPRLILFKILKMTGLINYYWNKQLKVNNAFNSRYSTPYK